MAGVRIRTGVELPRSDCTWRTGTVRCGNVRIQKIPRSCGSDAEKVKIFEKNAAREIFSEWIFLSAVGEYSVGERVVKMSGTERAESETDGREEAECGVCSVMR